MRNFTLPLVLLMVSVFVPGSGLVAQCINFNGDMEILNDPATNFPAGYYDYTDGTITSSVIMPGLSGSGTGAESTQSGGNFAGYAIGVSGITAGETYTFSVEVEVTSAAIDFANIYISWRDNGGAEIGTEFSGNANPGEGVVTLTATGVAPANTEQLQFAINFKNGTVRMDNFCVEQGAPGNTFDCPDNLVGNGSLDNDTGGWFTFAGTGINGTADAYAGPMAGTWAQNSQAAFVITENIVPGNKISFSAYIKSAAGQIVFGFKNLDNGSEIYSGTGFTSNGGSDYEFVINDINTIPEGTDEIILFIQGDGGAGSPGGSFDNVCVQDLGPDPGFTFPVTLRSFSGEAMDKYNKLEWVTATEENTAMFYVQRSADGRNNWTDVAELPATGNSRAEVAYSARDENPLPQGFYRLRSIDFDGSDQLSDVIRLQRAGELVAYPNPFTEQLTVGTQLAENGRYRLLDVTGRVLRSGVVTEGATQLIIPTATLPVGQYILQVGQTAIKVVK